MKRMLKIIVPIAVCFALYYFSFLAPYNLADARKAKNLSILNEADVLSDYFKDQNIVRIKYLGTNTYEVFTERGQFIVIADYSEYGFKRYSIFKNDKELEYFTNPM